MTLPTGTVFLSQVITEFGPTGPSPSPNLLSSYKKSPTGPYVGCSPNTTNIPSTNPIYLHSFAGEAKGSTGAFSSSTAGSGTVPIPSGTVSFIVEVWGGGGGGGGGSIPICTCGGGGGSGAYSRSSYTLPTPYSSYWGKKINFTVGGGGAGAPASSNNNTRASSGTNSIVSSAPSCGFTPLVTMTAFGGWGGYSKSGASGCGGPTAAGGNVINLSGNPGVACLRAGGPAVTGITSPGGGAGGPGTALTGNHGSCGIVRFTWS